MRPVYRILALMLILTLSLSLPCLTGCGERDREIDREEVLREGRRLAERSILLEDIFYGKGIPYREEETLREGHYYPAVPTVGEKYGFQTVEEMRLLTYATYQTDMAEAILSTKLSPIQDGNMLVSAARYYQKYREDKTTPECIMVYSEAVVLLTDTLDYRLDGLEVDHVKGEVIYLSLPVTVTRADGKQQQRTVVFSIVEQADGYRITSPTYARYVEERT